MPKELKSKDEFTKLLEDAAEVRIIRDGANAKVKVRTRAGLYTFKTTAEDADALIKGLKAPVLEF